MKIVDVVGAVILNEQQEVLCALRSQAMSLPGLWEFPGGKIEPGESPQESLVREIHEELDCTITVEDMVAEVAHHYPTVIIKLSTYNATIVSGTPTPKEHEKLMWLPIKQLTTLEWAPADVPTIVALMKRG